MKKSTLFIFAAIACVLMTSCASKGPSSSKTPVDNGIVLTSGWILCNENDEGKMVTAAYAEAGDSIGIVLQKDEETKELVMVRKNATWYIESTKKEYTDMDFVKVRYDNKEYWTRTINVSNCGFTTALVIPFDTFAFKAADVAEISNVKFEQDTILVTNGIVENGFYTVKAYSSSTPFGREYYVEETKVITDPRGLELVRTFSKLNDKIETEVADEVVSTIITAWGLDKEQVSGTAETKLQDYLINKLVSKNLTSVSPEVRYSVYNK